MIAGACAPDTAPPGAPARAQQVFSAHSFTVERETGADPVVLAGVSAPDRARHPEAVAAGRAALASRLEQAGAAVTLSAGAEPDRDRFGRLIARAQTPQGDLAAILVREGHLIVWPREGDRINHRALFAAEAEARAARSGAWGAGVFVVHGPDPNALAQHLDSAVIAEGLVVDTGEARDGRVFVNFGLDWRTDFTATADRPARERFEAAGVDLRALEGARIRVRGWLYETNGPAISLAHPAQIELVDAPEPRRLRD